MDKYLVNGFGLPDQRKVERELETQNGVPICCGEVTEVIKAAPLGDFHCKQCRSMYTGPK